jgi:hypothetical protein
MSLSTDLRLAIDNVLRVETDLLGQLQKRIELCGILFERSERLPQLSLPIAANILGDFVGTMHENCQRTISREGRTKYLGGFSDVARGEDHRFVIGTGNCVTE